MLCILLLQILLDIHRNHKAYEEWRAQDGHLDFHTAPEFCALHGKGVISASSEFCALHGKGVIITSSELCTLHGKGVISASSEFCALHGKEGVIITSSEFCALHGKEGVIITSSELCTLHGKGVINASSELQSSAFCREKERVISASSVFQTVVHGSCCLRNLPPAMVSGCDREREGGRVCWGEGGGGYVCVCVHVYNKYMCGGGKMRGVHV